MDHLGTWTSTEVQMKEARFTLILVARMVPGIWVAVSMSRMIVSRFICDQWWLAK